MRLGGHIQDLPEIIPCPHIIHIPKIVDDTPHDKRQKKMQKPFYVFAQGFIPSQKERARDHEKAGNAHSGERVNDKGKQILPGRHFSVGTTEIVCHMDCNDHEEGCHPDQLQIIISLLHDLLRCRSALISLSPHLRPPLSSIPGSSALFLPALPLLPRSFPPFFIRLALTTAPSP